MPRRSRESRRVADVATLEGLVDALHDAIGAPRPTYRAEEPEDAIRIAIRAATALICDAAGRPYGSLGEVHPRVVEAWSLPAGRSTPRSTWTLLGLVPERIDARAVRSQPVDRDLAVVVDEATPVGEVLASPG